MIIVLFFFFNDTATTEIYTLSLHDALPIRGRGNVAIGWARDLERRGVQVTVNVVVPLGVPDMPDLPTESRSAIRSHGKTAIITVMNDEQLPDFIDGTPEGLAMEYPPEPEPEEDAEPKVEGEEEAAAEAET